MAPKSQHGFTHRYNSDGTIQSICLSCFRTVGTETHEAALATSEAMHVCELEEALRRFRELSSDSDRRTEN
jgi:hypothetical protein